MARDLSSAVSSQISLQEKRPALLFELGIVSGSTLYYTNSNTNITFPTGIQAYTAKAIKVSGINHSSEGQINRITVKIDNVNRVMSGYVDLNVFENRPLVIKRVYLDALSGTTDYNEIFHGIMESPSTLSRFWGPITATAGKPLHAKAITKQYTRLCNNIFGNKFCNSDGYSSLGSSDFYASGTIESATTNYFIDTSMTTGASAIPDNFWNYGIVKIGKSGTTYDRTVSDFTSATSKVNFNIEVPVTLDNSYRYIVYKGCAKTYNSCTAGFNWGPSQDNKNNFGGFLHIGRDKDKDSE